MGITKKTSTTKKHQLTEEQEKWLDSCIGWAPRLGMEGSQMRISDRYRWNFDEDSGEVTIWGSFNCSGQGLSDFKGIKFAYVSGSFNCSKNALTNLDGAPREVDGDFDCSYNQISRIEGKYKIGGTRHGFGRFDCSHNKLESLSGASFYGLDFDFSHNLLPNLKGADITLHVSYSDEEGYHTYSHIYLHDNKIETLKKLPKGIKYDHNISCVRKPKKPNVVIGHTVSGCFLIPLYL